MNFCFCTEKTDRSVATPRGDQLRLSSREVNSSWPPIDVAPLVGSPAIVRLPRRLSGQVVDDPSAWPELFPTKDQVEKERRRLHHIISNIVDWEASANTEALADARYEIAASIARGLNEPGPSPADPDFVISYLIDNAPSVIDPFSGGASISLEAQRLGLCAVGSDLNPVAVLLGKALVEIPSLFKGVRPVNPPNIAQPKIALLAATASNEALREDINYYGQLVNAQAIKKAGDLYALERIGSEKSIRPIAWIWARTVRSPDPSAKGAMVPLVSSFLLSAKPGRQSWIEPSIEPGLPDGYTVLVRTGQLSPSEIERAKRGTKAGKGNFVCLLTGSAISEKYLREEGEAGRLGTRLLAIVVEGDKGRLYLPPDRDLQPPIHEEHSGPEGELYDKALGFRVPAYGFHRWADLFNARQLAVLSLLGQLIKDVHTQIETDAYIAGFSADAKTLADGGLGARAYADAIVTYLGLALDRCVMAGNTLVRWNSVGEKAQHVFGRQAISMIWDYAETNLLGDATGSFKSSIEMAVNSLKFSNGVPGSISAVDAAQLDVRNTGESARTSLLRQCWLR